MRRIPTTLRGRKLELLHWPAQGADGQAPSAVFMHANGMPPAAYAPLLEELSAELNVYALPGRALWGAPQPDPSLQWADLADDICALIEAGLPGASPEPVIAIGHSLGATTSIYAAAARPDLFRALAIVEPAIVKAWQAAIIRMLPAAAMRKVGPAVGTLRKRDRWADRAEFVASCARSGLYAGISPAHMELFTDAAIRPARDGLGVELVYPKAWEAHFFTTPPWPGRALGRVQAPVVGVRGSASIYLDDAGWRGLTRTQPGGWFTQLQGFGHLLPMQGPSACAQALIEGLRAQAVLPAV